IDAIIKGIFAEGQLDESELTFKDLHYLSENFQRILTGIFHQRITYPDAKKSGQEANRKPEENHEVKHGAGGEAPKAAGSRDNARPSEAAAPPAEREKPTQPAPTAGEKPIAL
ncbi:MAG: HD family phosphohydrolase, partial [Desulfovibrio sp.]|nr:HD family phosphohydrolase [Desulfovibrio sp.]